MQSPSSPLTVTLVQTEIVWQQASENCERLAQRIDESINSDQISQSDLIVLPEMFNSGFTMSANKVAESMQGPSVQWLSAMAETYQSAITGSLVIRENEKNYNRMIFARPDGSLDYYDKRHLFRMAEEDKRYAAGESQKIIEWRGWRIALNVCYDLRFPVWCRSQNNVDLMLFVASWPAARRYPWQTLLKARAIENLCYVVGVNRIGTDPNGIDHVGDSCVLNFAGLEEAYLADRNCIVHKQLDHQSLHDFREKFPAWMDSDRFQIL